MNKQNVLLDNWDPDAAIDKLLSDYDETSMPLPDIEFQPHLLISKVRKYYMEYIIKMLSLNYENNQRLLNKNIYLPSAIWRCAKNIEMNAAQTCMVIQLYRKNIMLAIKELKKDTLKGKLHRNLYECLRKPPENDKKMQTTLNMPNECTCQCTCNKRKRRRVSESPISQSDNPNCMNSKDILNIPNEQISTIDKEAHSEIIHSIDIENSNLKIEPQKSIPNGIINPSNMDTASPKPLTRISVERQDSDELMLQLEKLFQGDSNDDDIFEGTLFDFSTHDDTSKKINTIPETPNPVIEKQDSIIETHAAQIKSLDDRLASLAGLLVNNNESTTQQKPEPVKQRKQSTKWLCEEYFLKVRLHEVLDQIRDSNRKKLLRIKQLLLDIFGDDSDDEEVVSPLDETPDFVISCKERIAPWVVKLLTPYYIRGRIKGKALFKALAKHLIRLIYQCSRYPSEYEVNSFVSDFLENHRMIRCEADFKQFRIENL